MAGNIVMNIKEQFEQVCWLVSNFDHWSIPFFELFSFSPMSAMFSLMTNKFISYKTSFVVISPVQHLPIYHQQIFDHHWVKCIVCSMRIRNQRNFSKSWISLMKSWKNTATNPFGIFDLFELISYSFSLKTRSNETLNEPIHSTGISRSESPSLPIVNQTSDNCEQVSSNSNESPTTTSATSLDDTESKRKNKITKLERRLNRLSRLIHQLEEKELSLDEMIYSDLYQVEAQLKKQAYDVIENLFFLINLISCSNVI